MNIHQTIMDWFGTVGSEPHDRSRSWEHCFTFFKQNGPSGIRKKKDHAALHLGFYLASWGMYRPSGFLLQHAYSAHEGVLDVLLQDYVSPLWEKEFGASENDRNLIPDVQKVAESIRQAYQLFGEATDTLVTKVLLGTLGCLPASDRYFRAGFKREGFGASSLNIDFVDRVFKFCRKNSIDLAKAQMAVQRSTGIRYPFMKLVDMYFHQIGVRVSAFPAP